jgi:serine protease AprX
VTRIATRIALVLWLTLASLVPGFAAAPHVAAAGLPAPIDPVVQQQMAANSQQRIPVIVEMQHASGVLAGANLQLAQQAFSLLQLNGQAQLALPLLSSAAGLANAAGINALSLIPGVAYIHLDAPVKAHDGFVSSANLVSAYPDAVTADRVWASGHGGQGVTVAVLDSGVTPDADLVQPSNRILAAVNFADSLGSMMDPGGHGTHVAGTIAGNGWRSGGQYIGVAPGANLVDVRVLDSNGNGRASSVIIGIQWALDHSAQYNIRVLNLSLGAPAPASYRLDPLSAAVEMAWLRGLVVVAAAGNSGGAPDSPGADPYVITVGATDDRGTAPVGDDLLAWFSAYGTPLGSTPKPDLVAPGRKIVSIRAPGSTLDRLLPERVVTASNGSTYFRLSGTSMSTAVVSGVAALVLEQHPGLTPNQLKALLTGTSRGFGQNSGATPNPAAIGAGLIDAYAAVGSGSRGAANAGRHPADPTSRNLYPALYNRAPLTWIDPSANGVLWNQLTWSTLSWDNLAWDNLAWDNIAWDNIAWDNLAWDNLAWDSTKWNNLAWDNLAWDSQSLD